MLQYDNSAFYYFMITVLTFYLVPTGYFLIRRVITQVYRRFNKDIDVSKVSVIGRRPTFTVFRGGEDYGGFDVIVLRQLAPRLNARPRISAAGNN